MEKISFKRYLTTVLAALLVLSTLGFAEDEKKEDESGIAKRLDTAPAEAGACSLADKPLTWSWW